MTKKCDSVSSPNFIHSRPPSPASVHTGHPSDNLRTLFGHPSDILCTVVYPDRATKPPIRVAPSNMLVMSTAIGNFQCNTPTPSKLVASENM